MLFFLDSFLGTMGMWFSWPGMNFIVIVYNFAIEYMTWNGDNKKRVVLW